MRILVVTAVLLLTVGCSGASDGAGQNPRLTPVPSPSSAAPPTTTSGTSGTTKSPTTSAVATAAPTAGAPVPTVANWVEAGAAADPADYHSATRDGVVTQLGDHVAFVTPTGDTRCMTDEKSDGALACLASFDNPPPRPDDVYGEWVGDWVEFDGTALEVGAARADPGQFGAGTGAELAYGATLRFADYQCRSDQSGLYCVNFAHQSAVALSNDGVTTFGCLRRTAPPAGVGVSFSCD